MTNSIPRKGNLLLVILYFIENLFNPFTPWCFIVNESLFRDQFFPIRILLFNQLYLFLPPHMFYLILSINSQLISGKLLIINAIFTFIPVRERASILMVFMLPYPSDQIICTSCIKSRMAFICHYVCICVFHSPLIIYKNSKKKIPACWREWRVSHLGQRGGLVCLRVVNGSGRRWLLYVLLHSPKGNLNQHHFLILNITPKATPSKAANST